MKNKLGFDGFNSIREVIAIHKRTKNDYFTKKSYRERDVRFETEIIHGRYAVASGQSDAGDESSRKYFPVYFYGDKALVRALEDRNSEYAKQSLTSQQTLGDALQSIENAICEDGGTFDRKTELFFYDTVGKKRTKATSTPRKANTELDEDFDRVTQKLKSLLERG